MLLYFFLIKIKNLITRSIPEKLFHVILTNGFVTIHLLLLSRKHLDFVVTIVNRLRPGKIILVRVSKKFKDEQASH